MSKKILITGGTGFIGHHLAKKCLKFNWSVTSLSTKKPAKQRKLNKVIISKKCLFFINEMFLLCKKATITPANNSQILEDNK